MTIAIAIAGVLASSPDEPASAAIDLEWHGIAGCPDAIAVRDRWEAALAGTGARVHVAAEVDRTDDARWRLVLETTGPAGRGAREIVADSCDALVEAAAVIVGMVGTGALADPVDAPPVLPPPVASPPAVEPAPRAAAPTPSPASRRFLPGWGARIGGGLDIGVLPALGATIAGELSAEWRWARMTLGALHAIERKHEDDGVAGSFAIAAATIGAGPILRRGPIELAGMGKVELGAVRAEGDGVQTTYVHRHFWLALEVAGELGWAFARDWVLGASAAAVFPTRRWGFEIGETSLGTLGPVGGRFGLFLGWRRLPPLRKPPTGGQR